MANTVETPVAEPAAENKVEKEPAAEPESTTTEEEPTEPEENKTEEENGNGHTEETEEDGNGHVEEAEEEETTLKRKDAPTEVEDSPKKKKLVDSDEKEPEAAVAET